MNKPRKRRWIRRAFRRYFIDAIAPWRWAFASLIIG